MALAGAGQKYLWTKDGGAPPAPSGLALQGFDYYSSHSWLLFLLGVQAWLQTLRHG